MYGLVWIMLVCGPFYLSYVLSGIHVLTIAQIIKTFVFSMFARLKRIEDIKSEFDNFDAFQ